MQLPRQKTTFSLRTSLSCYSLVVAFKDLRNLRLRSYDHGLIDDDELIVLYDLYYSILEAFYSPRGFCFCFEVKIGYRSGTALDLQLHKISAAEENSVLLQCSPIFVLPIRAPHDHIMFRSRHWKYKRSCL